MPTIRTVKHGLRLPNLVAQTATPAGAHTPGHLRRAATVYQREVEAQITHAVPGMCTWQT